MSVFKNRIKRILRWHTNRPCDQIFEDFGLVFVHVPKTGGTSIRALLQPFGPSRRRYPRMPKHPTAAEIRASLGGAAWSRMRSVAVVRNPWDWAVSSYFWWIQRAECHENLRPTVERIRAMGSFAAFVKSRWFLEHTHNFRFRDYSEWICVSGRPIVSYILRFENLHGDWEAFTSRHGLPLGSIPHENKTLRKDFRSYYDSETAEIVAGKFRRSIELFGYRFDP